MATTTKFQYPTLRGKSKARPIFFVYKFKYIDLNFQEGQYGKANRKQKTKPRSRTGS